MTLSWSVMTFRRVPHPFLPPSRPPRLGPCVFASPRSFMISLRSSPKPFQTQNCGASDALLRSLGLKMCTGTPSSSSLPQSSPAPYQRIVGSAPYLRKSFCYSDQLPINGFLLMEGGVEKVAPWSPTVFRCHDVAEFQGPERLDQRLLGIAPLTYPDFHPNSFLLTISDWPLLGEDSTRPSKVLVLSTLLSRIELAHS